MKKTEAHNDLQIGANRERAAWKRQLKLLEVRVNDADYNLSAVDIIEEFRYFAVSREKRTRQRAGGI